MSIQGFKEEIYELGRSISLSRMDKEILEILVNHPNTTINEMASKLSLLEL